MLSNFKQNFLNSQKDLSKNTQQLYQSKKFDRNLIQQIISNDKYLHHHVGFGLNKYVDFNNQIIKTREIQKLENNQANFIIDCLNLSNNSFLKIADLGCGRGGTMFMLADKYPKINIEGLNITDYHVEFCLERKRVNTNITKQNYLETTFSNENFDKIYCNEASEHALEIKELFKEVNRILKKNGSFILSTWIYDDNILTKNFDNTTLYKNIINNINIHYKCNIHNINEIEDAYKLYNFTKLEIYDKSYEVENYWKLRKNWVFESGIENDFITGHEKNFIKYYVYRFIKN